MSHRPNDQILEPRRLVSLIIALFVGVASAVTIAVLSAPAARAAEVAAPRLNEVAAVSVATKGAAHRVRIPARVRAGDRLVLALGWSSSARVKRLPGWQQLEARNARGFHARLWTRKATAADSGRQVRVRTTKATRAVLGVTAYRSTGTAATVTASNVAGSNRASRRHTAPSVRAADKGSWLVNVWSGASKKAPGWRLPAASTSRFSRATRGPGRVSMVLGDSNGAVATGTVRGRRATSRAKLDRSAMFSLVVSPGRAPVKPNPPVKPNTPPAAQFTASCDERVCGFDASGSTDADGDQLSYTWDFGDTKAGTGRTTEHEYAAAGTRTVRLTVDDGEDRATATKEVTAEPLPSPGDSSAQPSPGHAGLVPDSANVAMPHIDDGEIWDIEVVGDRAFVAGSFTSITDDAGNGDLVEQAALAAYDLETGLVDRDFRPTFAGGGDADSMVNAVEASPDGTKLYVAGSFNTINGVEKRKIASLDLDTGAPVAGFTATANSQATALEATDTTVYVGGRFATVNGQTRVGLAALDGATGAVDMGFDNQLSGGIGTNGVLTVQQLKLTHDNSKLLVVHTARRIDGQDRYGVGLIGTTSKELLPWRTRLWQDNLQYVGGIQRIYGGDIAPDDSYFVVSSGSGGDRPPINDTAVAFSFGGGDNRQPRWISRAFDSVYSIAITERAVYIGGHFQWNESPTAPDPWPGLDNVGYGTGQGLAAYALGDAVVRRDHLGALNPANGKALEWHPGSDSIEGNKAMLATPQGLITGGDARRQGREAVGRVALFDFAQLEQPQPDTRITTPIQGRVVAAGDQFVIQGTAPPPPRSTGSRSRSRAAASSSRTTAPGAPSSPASTRRWAPPPTADARGRSRSPSTTPAR